MAIELLGTVLMHQAMSLDPTTVADHTFRLF